jgi:hypothetical protein
LNAGAHVSVLERAVEENSDAIPDAERAVITEDLVSGCLPVDCGEGNESSVQDVFTREFLELWIEIQQLAIGSSRQATNELAIELSGAGLVATRGLARNPVAHIAAGEHSYGLP